MKVCKLCKKPLLSGNRNTEDELPNELKLQITKKEIKELKRGNSLWWSINGKKKLGYCEVWLYYKKNKKKR